MQMISLALPMFPELTKAQIEFVIETFQKQLVQDNDLKANLGKTNRGLQQSETSVPIAPLLRCCSLARRGKERATDVPSLSAISMNPFMDRNNGTTP